VLAVEDGFGVVHLYDPNTGREYARLEVASQVRPIPQCFTPDGAQLITSNLEEGTIQIWNLRAIREQLAEMDLDWGLPPYPPPQETHSGPLRIEVDMADFGMTDAQKTSYWQQQVAFNSIRLALNPFDVEAALRRGKADIRLAEHVREMDAADRDAVARGQHTQAEILAQKKQPQEAAKVFRQAIAGWEKLAKDFPNRPEFRQHLAWSYEHLAGVLNDSKESGEAEKAQVQAVDLFEKLAADFPERGEYRQLQGHRLWRLGAIRAARSQLQEAEKAYRQAALVFEKLAGDFPKTPGFQQELGFTYYDFLGSLLTRANRSEDAQQAYRKAVAVHERLVTEFPNADYMQRLSLCYELLAESMKANGRSQDAQTVGRQATEFYEKLARANPTSVECREEIGRVARQRRQWDKAIDAYTQAIKLAPKRWGPWSSRGFAHLHLQQWDKCIQDYTKAIELAPDVHTNWHHRGLVYMRLGQWDNVVADYSSLLEKYPADYNAWYSRAVAYVKLNQPEQAVADLRQAVAKGYKNVQGIKKDESFAPLRTRADFKKLLAEVELKAQEAIRQAIAVNEKLAAEFPGKVEYRAAVIADWKNSWPPACLKRQRRSIDWRLPRLKNWQR
jgi:tetratricopeptide (TPR) repeat protein